MSIRMRLREERAQATVEMAVVTPVLLVLALIVYNVMIFASAVARFDRVVPDIVLAHAVASEAMTCGSKCRASKARRHWMVACFPYPVRLGPTPAPCTMSRGRLLSASLAFRWGRRQRCHTSAR